ncbi:DUF4376 domain-containing protein [Desulfopila inferna]|uniref:DUF4376 domain-containing protein n=1 Tax=Desulfopila inferna TaxID=468528 RepID=UPI001964C7A3|nr:DUF4376 domain-containing protein [Desulfopila inferna]MBM9605977.1 DUF4376 domain-containing protein [Desulfopila inferna]
MIGYKWANEERTAVIRYPGTYVIENGTGWEEFLDWREGGNEPDQWKTLLERKQDKVNEIKQAFVIAPKSGLTTSLGIKVDCKREDKDNFQELLDYCTRKSLAGTSIRLHNNDFAEVSVADLQIIINEIQEHGLTLYQRKWAKEAAIDQATTEVQIKAITWDSVE